MLSRALPQWGRGRLDVIALPVAAVDLSLCCVAKVPTKLAMLELPTICTDKNRELATPVILYWPERSTVSNPAGIRHRCDCLNPADES